MSLTVQLHTIGEQAAQLRSITSKVSREPARFVNAASITGLGILRALGGDVISGSVLSISGAKDLYNMLTADHGSHLEAVLREAKASGESLKIFHQENMKSLERINGHLELIASSMKSMDSILTDLSAINAQASQEVEMLKRRITEDCHNTLEQLQIAKTALQTAHRRIGSIDNMFQVSIDEIQSLEKQAELIKAGQKDEGLFKAFGATASRIIEAIRAAQEQVGNSDQEMETIGQALALASRHQASLSQYSLESLVKLSKALEQTQEKVQSLQQENTKCRKELKASQEELEEMRFLNQQMGAVIEDLEKELEMAQAAAVYTASAGEILVGGGSTAIAAAAVIGVGTVTATAVVAASPLLGTFAYKNRTTIQKLASWLFNRPNTEPKLNPSRQAPVDAAFDRVSSGYWNTYVVGKQGSTTVGTVEVMLPNNKLVSCRFNLNDEHPVAKADVLHLVKEMKQCLEKDPSSAAGCLRIINDLRSMTFDRGIQGKITGLVKQTSPILNYLERLCIKTKKLVG